jgi:hypothetical protein
MIKSLFQFVNWKSEPQNIEYRMSNFEGDL